MFNRKLELTRRISAEAADKIDEILSKLENIPDLIKKLVEDLEARCWQNSSLTHQDMPFVALLAYQEGKISITQFATLMSFRSASLTYKNPLRAIPLLNKDGTPNREFGMLIYQNLQQPELPPHLTEALKSALGPIGFKVRNSSYLTADQIKEFLARAKKLPASEQVIFVVAETVDMLEQVKPTYQTTIVDVLSSLTINFDALGRTYAHAGASNMMAHIKDSTTIIASAGLDDLYNEMKFPGQAVRAAHVIGPSTVDDIIRDGKFDERDTMWDFPFIPTPDEADNYLAKKYDFTRHDKYHRFAAGAIPSVHRCIFTWIGEAIKEFATKEGIQEAEARSLNAIADSFIDMEHPFYRARFAPQNPCGTQEPELPIELLFYMSVVLALAKPFLLNVDLKKRLPGKYPEYIQLSEKTNAELINVVCQQILKYGKSIARYSINNFKAITDYYLNTAKSVAALELPKEALELIELNVESAKIAVDFGCALVRLFRDNHYMFFSPPAHRPADERPVLILQATEAKDKALPTSKI